MLCNSNNSLYDISSVKNDGIFLSTHSFGIPIIPFGACVGTRCFCPGRWGACVVYLSFAGGPAWR